MTQNNYTTEKLLETLFGNSSYQYKNLTTEEVTALRTLNYSTIDWDMYLSKGLLTKEDVHKRVAVYKQLLALDDEITKRQEKQKAAPRFKKGDTLKTKNGDVLFITGVVLPKHSDENITYKFVNQDGISDYKIESRLLEMLGDKK